MAKAVLISMGPRDRVCEDAAQLLAARGGVALSEVVRLDDLAERARTGDPSLAALFADARDACVAACSRPRAARALLAFAGVRLPPNVAWMTLPFDRAALKAEYGVPWYPVIDRERCSGCGTCHDYCLFSVYSRDAAKPAGERVRVTAPLNCKTGCPACARLCPEGALIFPFCQEAELNGEVENPVHRSTEALAAALGEDPMKLLAERRKQRQRLIDPARFEQAERDRITYSGVL